MDGYLTLLNVGMKLETKHLEAFNTLKTSKLRKYIDQSYFRLEI